ncbi:MAG: LLM class F420-dependent oxidoreductase [Chloroflexi bacterium]|nr:LLM class F420-dependent oxidoreductase [Chloroflexota bacterium]
MIEIALMIEGQNGLTWPRWKRIVKAAEDLGFAGLYRSDHFTGSNPPDQDSLELWVSLTWLADHTRRIEFGPLVTPVSFRHPAMTARMAGAVDDLSGGRLQLGLGAGWQEREHHKYGFDLLSVSQRFQRFEEGLQVITHLLRKEEPLTFHGTYYQMDEAILLPRPQRAGGPPVVIGGNGPQLTLPLAARYADEWNCVYQTSEKFKVLNEKLDQELNQVDRKPSSVRRTMMTGVRIAQNEKALAEKLAGNNPDELRQRGAIVGTPAQVVEQVQRLEQTGLQRVMLQWLDLDDLKGIELLARTLIH